MINKKAVMYSNFYNDRQRMRKDLRQSKFKSGVYELVNLCNGHTYIGISTNLLQRINNYLNPSHVAARVEGRPIMKALIKYGSDQFACNILEFIPDDSLDAAEIKYISENKPYYNILSGGRSGFSGYSHSEEIKAKLSVLASSRVISEKAKALLSQNITGVNNPFYGIKHSLETKQQISRTKTHGSVYVYNTFLELPALQVVSSARACVKVLGLSSEYFKLSLDKGLPIRGGWYVSKDPHTYGSDSQAPLIAQGSPELEREVQLIPAQLIKESKELFLSSIRNDNLFKYMRAFLIVLNTTTLKPR